MKHSLIGLVVGGLVLAACAKNGEPFLSFGELCASRAADVCSARTSCCAEESQSDDCLERETNDCQALRMRIARVEEDQVYDSEAAALVAAEQREALAECSAPFPLTRFFQGTLEEGSPCARATQCTSGVCGVDTQVCESAEEVTLCPGE